MTEEWHATFTSDREAALALKRRRVSWGSKAPDHFAVEAGKLCILLSGFLLSVTKVISPRDLFAFVLGYFGLSISMRRVKPNLLFKFGPKELAQGAGGTITISERGLTTKSEETELFLPWNRVPRPTVYKDGLVFRIAHEMAIPFPTDNVDTPTEEIAKAVERWKAGK